MIKKSLPLIFILFYFCGFSQKTIHKKIESYLLETTRNIRIFIPEGYERDSVKNYPLTIVLDEEYLFDTYVGNAILFAKKDKAPAQIIVGVSMEESKGKDISFDINSGRLTPSADNFYQFIRDEVLFYMESSYRTSPFISFVGHGYSANLITHFLQEDTAFINSFICINPSFSDFIGDELAYYNLPKFGKEDNTFYFYSNNSNSFPSTKQQKIAEVQEGLSALEIKNFNVINDDIRVGILTIREKWEKYLSLTTTTITQEYLEEKYPMVELEENILINASFCPVAINKIAIQIK